MKTDVILKEDVQDELKWDAQIRKADIKAEVKSGVVTLTGTVKSYAEKRAAEKAAERVRGVKAIVQKIRVDLTETHLRPDQEIAQVALSNLQWDTRVPADSVKLKVENGWITLEGKVAWNYQREAAEKAVNNLYGIQGVSNLIEVNTPVQAHIVKGSIKKAFERNAIIDAQKIQVSVEGHKVLLSGVVQSWDEQKQALHAAWSAPGVWKVENKLEIKPRKFVDVIA